jgi:hypothetical protein
MSFPRLALVLTAALGLPLLTGGCGAPVAATAAVSYGSDGASLVGTGKSTTDHFASMVSKKDCALWRVFRNQTICREQEGDPNPYHVNYDEPFRDTGNGMPEYSSPLRGPANAPATSWDAAVYTQPSSQQAATTPAAKPEDKPAAAPTVTAEATPAPVTVAPPPPTKAKKKHVDGRSAAKSKTKAKPKTEPAKTPSPDPAAPAL